MLIDGNWTWNAPSSNVCEDGLPTLIVAGLRIEQCPAAPNSPLGGLQGHVRHTCTCADTHAGLRLSYRATHLRLCALTAGPKHARAREAALCYVSGGHTITRVEGTSSLMVRAAAPGRPGRSAAGGGLLLGEGLLRTVKPRARLGGQEVRKVHLGRRAALRFEGLLEVSRRALELAELEGVHTDIVEVAARRRKGGSLTEELLGELFVTHWPRSHVV
mmetsp:Transcript_46374/g.121705  ORF Transcript_46374/g.121705 Transcript_46374/m.121705 type:complete len:217 (+) Transcript_46374:124-774(+)